MVLPFSRFKAEREYAMTSEKERSTIPSFEPMKAEKSFTNSLFFSPGPIFSSTMVCRTASISFLVNVGLVNLIDIAIDKI